MKTYEALSEYQQELVSYVYNMGNHTTYEQVYEWLDLHIPHWKEKETKC